MIEDPKKHQLFLKDELIKNIFASFPDAITVIDLNGNITECNQAALDMLGYSSKDEVIGRSGFALVAEKDRERAKGNLKKVLDHGSIKNVEYIALTKDGTEFSAELSASVIRDSSGNPTGFMAITKDITERKQAEEERREVMEKLEVTNDKLQVVGGLTRHDVRNKLTVVTGNAYLARKKLSGNSEVLDYMKQIETSVEQIVRILDFAKAYEMLGVEELVYVDVEKAVNEAVSLFQPLKDIKVINDCHGLIVMADSLLKQLFYNLIDNSLKYGEKLSRIKVHYEEKNSGHMKVIYEDDGVGILQAAKPKIFHGGFTTGKGSGYGLYLVKKMMEVYGWAIQETGTPGKGAQFTMTIPRISKEGKENYRLS